MSMNVTVTAEPEFSDLSGVDPIFAFPTLLSWILGLMAIFIQCAFAYREQQAGQLAHLQFSANVAAFISACGSMAGNFGFYHTASPGGWCTFEALCSSFGELALILWVIGTALFTGMQIRQWPADLSIRTQMVYYFHIPVWGLSFLLTVIPAGTGALGLYRNTEEEYWCWMKPGQRGWEWAQFYVPLLISNVVSAVAFGMCLYTLMAVREQIAGMRRKSTAAHDEHSIEAQAARQKDERAAEEQLWLYIRLSLQFFVLFFVYVPDSIVYYATYDDGANSVETGGSITAHFLWKLEGTAAALLWFSNLRVRQEIMKLPWIVKFLKWCNEANRCGFCPAVCTCCHVGAQERLATAQAHQAAAANAAGGGRRKSQPTVAGGGHSPVAGTELAAVSPATTASPSPVTAPAAATASTSTSDSDAAAAGGEKKGGVQRAKSSNRPPRQKTADDGGARALGLDGAAVPVIDIRPSIMVGAGVTSLLPAATTAAAPDNAAPAAIGRQESGGGADVSTTRNIVGDAIAQNPQIAAGAASPDAITVVVDSGAAAVPETRSTGLSIEGSGEVTGSAAPTAVAPLVPVRMVNCCNCSKSTPAGYNCSMCEEPLCTDAYCVVKKHGKRFCRSCAIQQSDG